MMRVHDTAKHRRAIAIFALVCILLQLICAPYLVFLGGKINFAFVFCACVALTWGGRTGLLSGFFSGLFFDFTSTSPIGLMTCELTILALIIDYKTSEHSMGDVARARHACFIGCFAVTLLYIVVDILFESHGFILHALLWRVLPSTLLTYVCCIPCLSLFSHIFADSNTFSGSRGVFLRHASGRKMHAKSGASRFSGRKL